MGWDRDRSCGDGVGMGMVFVVMIEDYGVYFLSLCIPLLSTHGELFNQNRIICTDHHGYNTTL